jgi:hypothetical protein
MVARFPSFNLPTMPRLPASISTNASAPRCAWLTFALALTAIVLAPRAAAQGCVAIKQMDGSMVCSMDGHTIDDPTKWTLSVNYEHFRSHRHFVGSDQQFQRYALGSEVINVVEQVDVSLSYELNSRTSLIFDVPYFYASRSSLYEHDRVHRYTTHGRGIGDIRFGVSRWLRDPATAPSNNLALGIAIKAPTGDSNYKDDFHTTGGIVRRNVDQSIQPGDGGWGVAVSGQAYQKLTGRLSLYATGFYLSNPKETSGTRSTSAITSPTAYYSIADQYQARAGVSCLIAARHAITGTLGLRVEGVPGSDLIGGDAGFRRPGYAVSVEPGLSFSPTKRDTFSLSVPYVVERNRTISYADKINHSHGDAAFADFLINAGYSRRF